MAKEVVYNNSAEVFGVYLAEAGMFTFDIAVVIVLLTFGLLDRDGHGVRAPAWACAGLYLIFSLIWHTSPI